MPGELLSVLVSISRGHNEIQTIEKNFQSETPGTKITFCRHSQSQKGNSAILERLFFIWGRFNFKCEINYALGNQIQSSNA